MLTLNPHDKTVSYVMAAWGGGGSCNRSLKILQPTLNDYNESRRPITASIETQSVRFCYTSRDLCKMCFHHNLSTYYLLIG